METAEVIAIYAASLSTILALGQAAGAWRHRKRLSVSAGLAYSTDRSTYGTPVVSKRGEDTLDETVTIGLTIRNLGGTPAQALSLLIEGMDKDSKRLQAMHLRPKGLPAVLEAGTAVEVNTQKENLDLLETCTFLGVVDGAGRRHAVPAKQAAALVRQSWRLPTRVDVYHRRDDATKRVVAFQPVDIVSFTSTSGGAFGWPGRRLRVVAERPRPLIDTLMSGEQPRAERPNPSPSDPGK